MSTRETIKKYAKERRVFLWQVAEELGLSDFYFSKLLRHPLPEEKANEIIRIIDEIAKNR